MKVYIADNYEIKDYSLPNKVEDSFLINYVSNTGVEETLTFVAENGKWTISSNYDISITDGVVHITKDIIDDFKFYQVKFSDLDDAINVYCFKTPMITCSYNIGTISSISLGRRNGDIIYDNVWISENHFNIKKINDSWMIEDDLSNNSVIFLNGKRCHKSVLSLGDVIFTNGLKIIWMGTFIKVNNPKGVLKVNLEQLKDFSMLGADNVYTPVKETDKALVLYQENQTFFHTPRLRSYLKSKEINIVNPPTKNDMEEPPAILTLGATIVMGISSSISGLMFIFGMTGGASLPSIIAEIVICISMLMGCVLFPILLNKYNKRKAEKRENNRQKRYTEYLEGKKLDISKELELEKKILYENNFSIEECKNNIKTGNKLWIREISDLDFLTLRLGVGNRKSKITINARLEEFSLDDDNLREEVKKIVNTPLVLNDVPITISLLENRVLPLIITDSFPYRRQFVEGLMLQLLTYCSGSDLKIVIFTDDDHAFFWDSYKFTPYLYSKDKKNHFFATNEDEMKQVSSYLEGLYNDRLKNVNRFDEDKKDTIDIRENVYKNFDDYYLIITDNFISTKKIPIIERVVNSTVNIGFSLLAIDNSMKNVPSKGNTFVQIDTNGGHISGMDLTNIEQLNFKVECFMNDSINNYIPIISNIPISFMSNGSSLPTSISFLEMYKVGKIDQLNIVNRWSNNNPTNSLSTPIGVNEEGKLFNLDLHEKFQGPHGLIAGSTGSGKSEFIITFILSMAINYHPYEVQFVLIDYKGGGLAGAFENKETGVKLPHLAGTITNLDTSEMNRTMVSIKSELQRRQKLFNAARDKLGESTVDIYKYQKFYREGLLSEPISHLFIISDEFAELKTQQPDFMTELVSIARIGRSLGVHLILATQKPSGVVDDQIWSNSRFKVCLKVQTPEDSNELLKRDDAAYIKETGRFYLQVGYNETFELGQSAWSGAKYYPTDRIIKNIDDSINFINNTGDVIKTINDVVKFDLSKDYGDQLGNIVRTLYNISVRENIKLSSLWLPSIPKEIFLSSLIDKYKYVASPYEINPIVGEYDIPEKQLQKLLTVDLTNKGNLIIYGIPGCGKENLLITLIYSICISHSPEEVNMYLLDFGAEVLKGFKNYAHVGDVVLIDDADKIKSEFLMLEKEINRRKDLFSEYGGNYVSYIKNSGNKLPLIITVLNGYESFLENYSSYSDFYNHLLRECTKYGIVFIMTVSSTNNVTSRVSQLFQNKICLQLSDKFDYRYTLNAPHGLVPASNFGRGVASIGDTAYEFQTAFIYLRDQITETIKSTANKLNQIYPIKVREIPVIPNVVNSDTMLPYIDNITNVPIGIDCYDASVVKFDFSKNKIVKIIGKSVILENKFIVNLINIFSSIPSIKLKIIDFSRSLSDVSGEFEYYNDNFTASITSIVDAEKQTKCKIVYLLVGIGYIYDVVLDEGINALSTILNNTDKLNNSYFILVDNLVTCKKIMNESWYRYVSNDCGIWVGKGIDLQNCFKIDDLSKDDANEDVNGLIYSIVSGKYRVVKGIGAESKNNDY